MSDNPYIDFVNNTDLDVSSLSPEAYRLMREQFPNEVADDETIIRFLLARSGDVQKASTMLSTHINWREKNYPILKSQVINELRKGKLHLYGYDKDGHPLIVYSARFHSCKDRSIEEMMYLAIYLMNFAAKHLPPNRSKFTVLVDRTQIRSDSQDMEVVKRIGSVMQDNFPERVHKALIYPSGLVFYGLWNIAKWFFDPVTRNKVTPCIDVSGVREFIDDEYIPKSMGGSCEYVFDAASLPENPFDELPTMKETIQQSTEVTAQSYEKAENK